MGAFCCRGHRSFDPTCLKTLCSLSPSPVMLHIKFGQDWPIGLGDIQVQKCKIYVFQGQVTSKSVVWSGLKSNSSEFLCLAWLPATLTMIQSKMNDLAWRHHFPIVSLWDTFKTPRAANSVVSGAIWPKFGLVREQLHTFQILQTLWWPSWQYTLFLFFLRSLQALWDLKMKGIQKLFRKIQNCSDFMNQYNVTLIVNIYICIW